MSGMRYRKGGLPALVGKLIIVSALLIGAANLLGTGLDGERANERACRSTWSFEGCPDRSVPVDRSQLAGCVDVSVKPSYCIPD